jgi:DNA-binding transcriptional regulator GbsR (MarR family)
MKFIERLGIVRRIRKPKSRKIFFYMEKDMTGMLFQIIKRKYEKIVLPTKDKLPKIIEMYKSEKSRESKEELKVAETYYRQLAGCEKVLETLLGALEKEERVKNA